MSKITVALVQMEPRLGETEENVRRMAEFVQRICTEQPTELIIFPELATTGYELGLKSTTVAERIPGPMVNLMSKLARDFSTHIVFGMVLKEKVESILYNAAVVLGPEGDVIGDYRKIHLRVEERMAFRSGFRLPVFETEFGEIGVMLGWDLAFPEVARSLVLEGAELICVPASWEASSIETWRMYLRARAMENAVFVAGANRVGEEPSLAFGGESALFGPDGTEHTRMDEPLEGYAVATFDLDQVRTVREESQLIQSRQPAVYRAVVKKY